MILKIENLIEFLNSKEGFYCSRQDMKNKNMRQFGVAHEI